MAVSVKHTTLTTESPTGAGGTVGATEWDADHDVPVASQAQAEAGTDTSTLMTPERTAQAIAALATGGGGGGDAYIRRPVFFAVGGPSSVQGFGNPNRSITPAFTTTGTQSAYTPVSGVHATEITCSATANATASSRTAIGHFLPPLSSRRSPAIGMSAVIEFADASYGSGATGARLAAGVSIDVPNALASDGGTSDCQGFWFSYSTNRGGNWQVVIMRSAGVSTTVDTGVAFSSGTWAFAFDFIEDSQTATWRIRKIGTSTAATGTVTNTSNPFPIFGSSDCYIFVGLTTLSAIARGLRVQRFGIDHLEPL